MEIVVAARSMAPAPMARVMAEKKTVRAVTCAISHPAAQARARRSTAPDIAARSSRLKDRKGTMDTEAPKHSSTAMEIVMATATAPERKTPMQIPASARKVMRAHRNPNRVAMATAPRRSAQMKTVAVKAALARKLAANAVKVRRRKPSAVAALMHRRLRHLRRARTPAALMLEHLGARGRCPAQ